MTPEITVCPEPPLYEPLRGEMAEWPERINCENQISREGGCNQEQSREAQGVFIKKEEPCLKIYLKRFISCS
jgi:hypothetical protein